MKCSAVLCCRRVPVFVYLRSCDELRYCASESLLKYTLTPRLLEAVAEFRKISISWMSNVSRAECHLALESPFTVARLPYQLFSVIKLPKNRKNFVVTDWEVDCTELTNVKTVLS